ncbi:hypothetical protein BPY_09270 [Bifidobacterium psychraerophilum]
MSDSSENSRYYLIPISHNRGSVFSLFVKAINKHAHTEPLQEAYGNDFKINTFDRLTLPLKNRL